MSERTKVLVLGATGFIGSVIAQRLHDEGHVVTGLGRNLDRALNRHPDIRWLKVDLGDLGRAIDWTPVLHGQDIVVNCAGALQDGLHDDLAATQERAMLALYAAAGQTGIRLIVQISANTADAGTETAFLGTKRAADRALTESGVPYVILRPAVVIGRNAFGGTALLRALAALPGPIPLAYADNPVATVSVDDVATCVASAVAGVIQPRPSSVWSRPRSSPTISERRRPPAKPTSSMARSRSPRRVPRSSVSSMAIRSSGRIASFWRGGAACLLRMPAITVAMARSLRSSGMPCWVQFQPMAARRRSMVETAFGFMWRSAVPDAQAVI